MKNALLTLIAISVFASPVFAESQTIKTLDNSEKCWTDETWRQVWSPTLNSQDQWQNLKIRSGSSTCDVFETDQKGTVKLLGDSRTNPDGTPRKLKYPVPFQLETK